MRAVREAARAQQEASGDSGAVSSGGAASSSSSTEAAGAIADGPSTPASRRAVFAPPPLRAPPPFAPSTPLDLVAQLRGDFEAYTRDVYNGASAGRDSGEDPVSALDEMRERRQQERLQLDSLHARLHGLRLILAMAQLNVAATSELERGERVELMGETGGDVSPGGGVVLMTLGGPPPPPEPQGVPPKQLEELLPKTTVGKAEEGMTCSICICDLEEGETIRKLECDHCYHAQCIDKWFARSVLCPNCKRAVCEPPPPPERPAPELGEGGFGLELVGSPASILSPLEMLGGILGGSGGPAGPRESLPHSPARFFRFEREPSAASRVARRLALGDDDDDDDDDASLPPRPGIHLAGSLRPSQRANTSGIAEVAPPAANSGAENVAPSTSSAAAAAATPAAPSASTATAAASAAGGSSNGSGSGTGSGAAGSPSSSNAQRLAGAASALAGAISSGLRSISHSGTASGSAAGAGDSTPAAAASTAAAAASAAATTASIASNAGAYESAVASSTPRGDAATPSSSGSS